MINIETNRLILSPLQQQHWPLFLRLHSEPQVVTLCFDVPPQDIIRQKFAARLKPWTPDSDNWLGLVVADKASGAELGVTGFELQGGVAEVGYLFLPEFYGKGYAAEALQGLIDWASATHNINHYRAVVTEGNAASEKVLTKCGFVLQRIDANAHRIGGTFFADHIYRLSQE
ncbi:RimJ/RimL family protein N-acetyltransferase [Rheinheimera pacifica]|uniref:GNAT family N-acetyltransferase n=1 Tax=Rheinheimera pacifica TaxID=173990 RepID=UPI0028647A62|nr:GNAT family N-acetyltransferase [Rheinheimera pacifica]MDR6983696.1 RimJ/RimL family protein N-acetyltransferase [Rheinheimera pacifica]